MNTETRLFILGKTIADVSGQPYLEKGTLILVHRDDSGFFSLKPVRKSADGSFWTFPEMISE